ncbi:MAG TPA: SIMPL domain-containing protein [Candidatus Pacearchaeota archaeon]|nr:SIMPL domain-containing protein [Candidatus Pacearchaeota archaeon]
MIKLFENKFFQFLIFVLLIVFIAFLLSSIGNNTRLSENETITISGLGEVYAVPDIAVIDVAVLTESKTVEAAMSENTTKMNNIISALKQDLTIDEKDIKTTSFNISPRYAWEDKTGKRNLVGYEISQLINVKIRNLDATGNVIQKVTELGANSVSDLTFTFDNDQELKEEARNIAIKDAKEKAKDLEKELGIKMVRIVNFSESSYAPVTIRSGSMKVMNESLDYAAPTIEAGQNKITSNVSITYIIR